MKRILLLLTVLGMGWLIGAATAQTGAVQTNPATKVAPNAPGCLYWKPAP